MRRLGEMLVSRSACSRDDIREALYIQDFRGARLGTILLELGVVEEKDLADALSTLLQEPILFGDIAVDQRARSLIPRRLVEKHEAMPYSVTRHTLGVLVCDPCNLTAIDEFAFVAGRRVEPVVTLEARVRELMREHYGIYPKPRRRSGPAQPQLVLRPDDDPRLAQPLADYVWESEWRLTPAGQEELSA